MNWLSYLFLNFSTWYRLLWSGLYRCHVWMSQSRLRNRSILTHWMLWLNTWLMLHRWWCTIHLLRWHVLTLMNLRRWSSVHHLWIPLNTRSSIHWMNSMWSIKLLRWWSIFHRILLWHLRLLSLYKTWLVHQRTSVVLLRVWLIIIILCVLLLTFIIVHLQLLFFDNFYLWIIYYKKTRIKLD